MTLCFLKKLQVNNNFLVIFFALFILSSCSKHNNDNLDLPYNDNQNGYIENPYINFTINNKYSQKIIAYPDSVNQRISVGYGSGNIIGTDTCFVHYSCSFLKIIDTNHIEIKIEFFKTELKPYLKELYGAYYYPSIIELGGNLLFTGYRNILYRNDDKYYPGVKISYLDDNGNYFYSTDTLQQDSYFLIKSSETDRTVEYETCQKVKGSFSLKLRNISGDSLINFSSDYYAVFKNPF